MNCLYRFVFVSAGGGGGGGGGGLVSAVTNLPFSIQSVCIKIL